MAGALLSAVSVAQARDLTVVSWGGNFQDAQREINFKPFQQILGKPVLDQSWDGGIGVIQAKLKAGEPNWDVVEVESEDLGQGCSDGLFEKLDWTALGGKKSFIPTAVSDCGVGTMVWSTGLSYDANVLKSAPTSWADFWDTKKFPGKRALRKGPKYTLEFALMADGVAPKDVYKVLSTPAGVDRAFKKLDQLKGDLIWWDAGAASLQLLASGQVVMTAAYNGRITGIDRSEKKNFKFVFPGSIYAVDSWVILKGSPNKADAMKFIAYASKPDVQAKLPQYIAYGMTNTKAQALVPPQYAAELPTATENMKSAVPLDADFWTDNIGPLTQRFNAWLAK
ncbi:MULTISPECIES: ABC transporter substrate-binding protein [Paraburkholderia]|uniref:Spermidine/putrescine ABC transporter substrate-binding protein n=1 Tax=Paraburkholderia caffeinilytica TaxID=1761016 RepID=A0ABQ1NB79_9BURK|nr:MULTISPECIES: ABC transporter substrate-binding protein [Paraburkholderia]GGC64811.1 spermidine/putrescine ABC transporter substrate-binding protein [Paraburkholderia caffeinilytica]